MTNMTNSSLKMFKVDEHQAIVDAIKSDGACIVENLLSEDECHQLQSDFMPHLEALPWGVDELGYKNDFYGSNTKRLHGLFSKSKNMEAVLTNPCLIDVVRAILLQNNKSRDIRLSNTELMVLNQHQTVQEFHTDGASWYRAQAAEKVASEEILVSANIALTEFTATNGATRVVPGSHLWPKERVPLASEVCQALMPKGAALLYAGNVIHSGGANTDAMMRIGLYLGYIVSWLRPIENQMVTNQPADILKLGTAAKQLLDVVKGGFTVIA
jgi:ectoine hydroxylase-related dioxygenase (phytanoyl-CoA dioxygenase family)